MPLITVTFVCFANICRSPMAEAVLLHRLGEQGAAGRFTVQSRGTTAIHAGKPADPRTVAALRAAGIGGLQAHRARQIEDEDFARSRWLIALDPAVMRTLQDWTPRDWQGRIEVLTRFAPQPHGAGIADPWSSGPEPFTESLREIDRAVQGLAVTLLAEP